MEKVDIVDKNLKPLYSTTKAVAHKKGLLHPTIIAEVINSKGEWLLVKQAGHKQDAGRYVSPVGGHIKSGESEIDALKREVLEEVGLKNFKYRRIGQHIYNRKVKGKVENHYFIIYEIYSNGKVTLNEESIDYVRFPVVKIKQIIKESPNFFGKAFFQIRAVYPSLFSVDSV